MHNDSSLNLDEEISRIESALLELSRGEATSYVTPEELEALRTRFSTLADSTVAMHEISWLQNTERNMVNRMIDDSYFAQEVCAMHIGFAWWQWQHAATQGIRIALEQGQTLHSAIKQFFHQNDGKDGQFSSDKFQEKSALAAVIYSNAAKDSNFEWSTLPFAEHLKHLIFEDYLLRTQKIEKAALDSKAQLEHRISIVLSSQAQNQESIHDDTKDLMEKLDSIDNAMRSSGVEQKALFVSGALGELNQQFSKYLQDIRTFQVHLNDVVELLEDTGRVITVDSDREQRMKETVSLLTKQSSLQRFMHRIQRSSLCKEYTSALKQECKGIIDENALLEFFRGEDIGALRNGSLRPLDDDILSRLQHLNNPTDPDYTDAFIEIMWRYSDYELDIDLRINSVRQLSQAVRRFGVLDHSRPLDTRFQTNNIKEDLPDFLTFGPEIDYPRRRIKSLQLALEAQYVVTEWRARRQAKTEVLLTFQKKLISQKAAIKKSVKEARLALVRSLSLPQSHITLLIQYTYRRTTAGAASFFSLLSQYAIALRYFQEGDITSAEKIMYRYRNSIPALVLACLTKRDKFVVPMNTQTLARTSAFISDEDVQDRLARKEFDVFQAEEPTQHMQIKQGLHVHLLCDWLVQHKKNASPLPMPQTENEVIELIVEGLSSIDVLSQYGSEELISKEQIESRLSGLQSFVRSYVASRFPLMDGTHTSFTNQQMQFREQLFARLHQLSVQLYTKKLDERLAEVREAQAKYTLEQMPGSLPILFRALVSQVSSTKIPQLQIFVDDEALDLWNKSVEQTINACVAAHLHPIDAQLHLASLQQPTEKQSFVVIKQQILSMVSSIRKTVLKARAEMLESLLIDDVFAIWRPSGTTFCDGIASLLITTKPAFQHCRDNLQMVLQNYTDLYNSIIAKGIARTRQDMLSMLQPSLHTQVLRIALLHQLSDATTELKQLYAFILDSLPIIQSIGFLAHSGSSVAAILQDHIIILASVKQLQAIIASSSGKKYALNIERFIADSEKMHFGHEDAMRKLVKASFPALFTQASQEKVRNALRPLVKDSMEFLAKKDPSLVFLESLERLTRAQIDVLSKTEFALDGTKT